MDTPDAHSLLQNDLDSLNNLRQGWALEFSPTKFKVLNISKKKSSTGADNRNYSIGTRQLERVSSITDLGIKMGPSNLSWARHMEDTVTKANKTLGLIKRACRDLSQLTIRQLLYKYFVELPAAVHAFSSL